MTDITFFDGATGRWHGGFACVNEHIMGIISIPWALFTLDYAFCKVSIARI
jgi:hypothetical protein